MNKLLPYTILTLLTFLTVPIFATVSISRPGNGDTVGSPVQFVATAATGCSRGVASMGVYINNDLQRIQTGSSLNASISLSPGSYNAVIVEWDNCGAATTASRSIKVTGQTGVYVTSPANNSTVGSPASFVATAATSSCAQGVSSMGVYVDNALKYKVSGAKLNAQVAMAGGTHSTVVQEWDHCGGSSVAHIAVKVETATSNAKAKTLSRLQANNEWISWGQVGPKYIDCSPSPCEGIEWSHSLGVTSPSKSGNATKFTLGGSHGTAAYGDVLFTNALIGQGSSQGIPDNDHALIPTLHNFTYDTDVYVTNISVTQALEFDVSDWIGNQGGMTFGTECNYLGTKAWDVYDNSVRKWVSTGAPCKMVNGWNHLTIQLERGSGNSTLYKSITLNGTTYTLNRSYASPVAHPSWWGVNVNYQMDGNSKQSPNATYLDNLTLTYW
ncbi:MAG: hypothetical protein ACRD28_04305 [Acidobacteriaceae bacterium]